MEAKEKANELVQIFIPSTKFFDLKKGWVDSVNTAKDAACLCVDQIIKELTINECVNDINGIGEKGHITNGDFWNEVKAQISTL